MDKIIRNSITRLCKDREMFVPCGVEGEFVTNCNRLDVHPSGGIWFDKNDPHNPMGHIECRCYYLDSKITHSEGMVIAASHGMLDEYLHSIHTGSTPTEALREWDILPTPHRTEKEEELINITPAQAHRLILAVFAAKTIYREVTSLDQKSFLEIEVDPNGDTVLFHQYDHNEKEDNTVCFTLNQLKEFVSLADKALKELHS